MTDLLTEDRLTFNQLAKIVGKNPSTIWRWHLSGCRGVKLESYVEGGCRYTTRQAHRRFVEGCTAAANGTSLAVRTPAQRERDIRRAETELDRLGV